MNWADSHVEEGGTLVMDWARLHGAFQSDADQTEVASEPDGSTAATTG